uniref:Uncharacterized protein n=1 Tax=Anguilla anguilla TaxID=7936 RepID=A0A0E9UGR8_ANGAN
MLLHLLQVLVS